LKLRLRLRKPEKPGVFPYLPSPICYLLESMLRRLRIKNLAVVDEVEWELGQGFNVLTGETGAGKSILIDAFLLLLGERADKGLVRTGAESCLVEGELDGVREFEGWLEAKGVEPDPEGTLIIKRQISTAGTGRQFLNGSAVTLAVLKELGDRLVDLHGPHDHQALLAPAAQRAALDAFGGLEKHREEVQSAWREKKEAEEKLAAFRKRSSDPGRTRNWREPMQPPDTASGLSSWRPRSTSCWSQAKTTRWVSSEKRSGPWRNGSGWTGRPGRCGRKTSKSWRP